MGILLKEAWNIYNLKVTTKGFEFSFFWINHLVTDFFGHFTLKKTLARITLATLHRDIVPSPKAVATVERGLNKAWLTSPFHAAHELDWSHSSKTIQRNTPPTP